MKNSKKDRVINVRPFHSEIRRYEGGFEWTFTSDFASKIFGRRVIIKMKFDRWWVSYLAQDLKKVLKEEQIELERLKELTGFKED